MLQFFLRILLLLSFGSLVQYAKSQTYPFTNFGVENGLSQGQVLSVFQNDDGVMWFGTSGGGITLYDGHSFEYYTDKDGLADNVVFSIVKDKNGNILIGTNNGLSVFDSRNLSKDKKKKFINYTTKNGLGDNRIFCIVPDEQGGALLGTARGIGTFKNNICGIFKMGKQTDSASVFHILKNGENDYWLSTLGNGVFNYNRGSLKNYTSKQGLQNDMVFSVMKTNDNGFWFFTGEGLSELKGQKIKRIKPLGIDTNATYYSYYHDENKALWLGTSNGLIKINSKGKPTIFKKKNGLTNNSIWKIFQDKESNMWFASDQIGVSKLSSERFYMLTTKDGLLFDEIKNVYKNKNGDYYIGSKLGLSIYKENKLTNYTNKEMLGNADIWDITEDKKGNYLIGTGNGLLIYNGKKFKRLTSKNLESPINTIFHVFANPNGEIWLGTPVGLAKIKGGYIVPLNIAGVSKNYIHKIFKDTEENYWFCTDDGLYRYNGVNLKHFSDKDGFTQKRVRTIIEDANHNFWMATSAGVFVYRGNKFTNVTDQLNLASNEIYSLISDSEGNIWAGLSSGLIKIETKTTEYKVKNYSTADGFIGQGCSQNAMLINKDGHLMVGTSKGLIFYQSEYDKENFLEPITKLKSIDLFFEKTNWEQFADSLNENIPVDIELPYNKNYLTFNYIGVSLTSPEKVNYKYILKGIDKDWRTSFKTEASYSNIPPGNYEFILLANNGQGIWNKKPLTFKFKINPPFWRSWWFYSLIAIIILTGIYSYFKIRTANTKILKQNEIIEEKNGALQTANDLIAEKNQNITDSINYAQRIQQSFLTSEKIFNALLNEHFVLFKPRDIVSGDFYLAFDFKDRVTVVCADCTGHGIPGAFMSLVGISLLNEISRSQTVLNPAEILEELRNRIIAALNPEKSESGGKDGMDISVISIFKGRDSNGIKIHFSGANSSILQITPEGEKPVMHEFKGDKQPAGFHSNMKPFTLHELSAQSGDLIYMFTDGYADQFGGAYGKKLMSKQLRHHILSVCQLDLKDQKNHLDTILSKWQGNLEQVDDVTVIGIKLD